LRNVPYGGKYVTWFFARIPELTLFSSERVECSTPVQVLPHDLSERFMASGDDAITAALGDGERIVGIVGNIQDRTVSTAFRLREARRAYTARIYDSLKRAWLEPRRLSAQELEGGVTTAMEPKGFHVIELRPE